MDTGLGSRKAQRQQRILALIAAQVIDSQETLAQRLQEGGFPVTQATISRDIRELRLVKAPTGDGRYRYAAGIQSGYPVLSERMLGLFRECVVSCEDSENLVVIHTLPATAAGVAEAVDSLHAPEVVGSLSGERTVFVVIKPRSAVPRFLARVRHLLRSGGAQQAHGVPEVSWQPTERDPEPPG